MASSNATLIEGSHIIPKGVLEEYGHIFRDYLPGWEPDGEYNLKAGAKNSNVAEAPQSEGVTGVEFYEQECV